MLDLKPVIVTIADFDPPKFVVRYPNGTAGVLHDTFAAAKHEVNAIKSANDGLVEFLDGIAAKRLLEATGMKS